MNRYFKTSNRMRVAIDNAHRIEGMMEYLDQYYFSCYDLQLDEYGYSDIPYWIEHQRYETEDTIDLRVRHIEGIHTRKHLGDIDQIDGKNYELVDTVPLDPELEIQAGDGQFYHWYRGYSFLEVWRRNRRRELIVDECRGIYIPKVFKDIASDLGVQLTDYDKTVLSDPEHQEYWELWSDILRDTRIDIADVDYCLEHCDNGLFISEVE
jgi:hypothetical protein